MKKKKGPLKAAAPRTAVHFAKPAVFLKLLADGVEIRYSHHGYAFCNGHTKVGPQTGPVSVNCVRCCKALSKWTTWTYAAARVGVTSDSLNLRKPPAADGPKAPEGPQKEELKP